MSSQSQSLQHSEASARFDLLDVSSYDVRLDLASDETTFESVTTVAFTSRGGPTFVDLKPVSVRSVHLNGRPVDVDLIQRGRLPLDTSAGDNELVVEATMRFRNDGEGLHAHVDPADGKRYVYAMSFMDAAPSIFACFDQPDLKAPYTFHVTAPTDWVVVGNAPATQVEPGVWELETTQPLSTYFVTLVAGPYHLIRDEHDGIALGLSARASIAADLERDADELLTLTRQCFDEYHRLFGIHYPFGDYHQAFVPEFNAGAMENPGCVTFRDPLVFTSKVTRGVRIQRATTVAHEMAHQWFGNLVTPVWWDDLWLNESFAEYMGNRVTADVTQYDDAWTHVAYARRQWGLVADQRPSTHPVAGNGAADAVSALQDFDGISYAKGSSILKQLNTRLGDDVFFAGAIDHFTRHRFGNATMHDLFASWEHAGAGELSGFTGSWLRTAGPDTIELDRSAGVVRRTPPSAHPAERSHTFRVASAAPDGSWRGSSLSLDGSETPFATDGAVLLDPYEDTWALVRPDPVTLAALPALLPTTDDARLRAGAWNLVRNGFHNAVVDPASVIDLVEAGLDVESSDDALFYTLPWVTSKVVPLTADPESALRRVQVAALAKAVDAEPGSTLQLAAFQAAVSATGGPDGAELLKVWLDGTELPDGVEVDLDLRWQLLVQLASLGGVDRAGLQAALDAEPTAVSRVEHTRAVVSLPEPGAKEFAWARFTGEADVSNYDLEAAGLGMWRGGQEQLTQDYVARYFAELPGTAEHRSGWLLADATAAFFPRGELSQTTVVLAHALIADDRVDSSIRRRVVDQTDELERRLAVRRAFPVS